MSSSVGSDGPFESAVVESVAAEYGVSADRLADLVDRHQRSVKSLPGVEELVYEWRKQFDATVLERTPSTYAITVPPSVWDEFRAALDAPENLVDALVALHGETAARRADGPAELGEASAVVLDRRSLDE